MPPPSPAARAASWAKHTDIFVELRDLNDRPMTGYCLADCEEITGNDVAWEVRWRGRADVSSMAGTPVITAPARYRRD